MKNKDTELLDCYTTTNTLYKPSVGLKNFVLTQLVKNKMTLTDLAKINNTTLASLSHYITGNRSFTAKAFNKAFKPIGVYIDERSRVLRIEKKEN